MRLIILCLAALIILIQFPLWLGKGGWLRVWDLDRQVVAAQKKNDELRDRNAKLDSEVQDLKEGTGAIEERARYELGMIKENEIFVQVLDPNKKAPSAMSPSPPDNAGQPVKNQ
jgi:cell division protein FtsB